jgi:hypothetical protein
MMYVVHCMNHLDDPLTHVVPPKHLELGYCLPCTFQACLVFCFWFPQLLAKFNTVLHTRLFKYWYCTCLLSSPSCVRACMCVRARAHACLHACACACVTCLDMHKWASVYLFQWHYYICFFHKSVRSYSVCRQWVPNCYWTEHMWSSEVNYNHFNIYGWLDCIYALFWLSTHL